MLRRLNFKHAITISTVCLACSVTYADDLLSTLTLAMDVDTTLLEAEQSAYATMELLPQARSALLPLVTGTANTTYTNSNNPVIPNNNSYAYTATISQPILNLASWFQYKQVDYQIKAAVATYEDAKQDVVVRVTEQYFNILKARDDLVFALSEKKAFSQQLEQTRQKFKAGVIAITDVNEAQAKYDSANAQVITAQNELFNQKENMGIITGVPAKNVSILIPNINLSPPPDTMEKWVETAKEQNFALQSAQYDMRAAKGNINIQKAGHYPVVQVDGTASKAKTTPPNPAVANTNSVGITVTLPIYSGGNINALTRQAAHEYEISMQQMIRIEREVVTSTRQAFRGILTQISQVEALKQSVISSKSALDATQAAFDVGTRTIVDVLDAQTDLLNAKRQLATARYDYILESFKLKRFSGILSLEDVNIINNWLEPAKDDAIF